MLKFITQSDLKIDHNSKQIDFLVNYTNVDLLAKIQTTEYILVPSFCIFSETNKNNSETLQLSFLIFFSQSISGYFMYRKEFLGSVENLSLGFHSWWDEMHTWASCSWLHFFFVILQWIFRARPQFHSVESDNDSNLNNALFERSNRFVEKINKEQLNRKRFDGAFVIILPLIISCNLLKSH